MPATILRIVTGMKKGPDLRLSLLVFALPIFPCSHPQSIVGVHVLNFCVRDGNRWTHMTINTNSMDGCYTIFYIKGLLTYDSLVTRTGFEPMLTA